MMTPQEVSEFRFPKASFGGYNMASVDNFLDQVTVDYSALYKENATLKAKMKVLADSLEEYRVTEKGMRRALLAAQKEAEEVVRQAEIRKNELIQAAAAESQARIEELRQQVAVEEDRLNSAKTVTQQYIDQIRLAHDKLGLDLDALDSLEAPVIETPAEDDKVQEIGETVQKLVEEKPPEVEAEQSAEESGQSHRDQERARPFVHASAQELSSDDMPTRRIDFNDPQAGKEDT